MTEQKKSDFIIITVFLCNLRLLYGMAPTQLGEIISGKVFSTFSQYFDEIYILKKLRKLIFREDYLRVPNTTGVPNKSASRNFSEI